MLLAIPVAYLAFVVAVSFLRPESKGTVVISGPEGDVEMSAFGCRTNVGNMYVSLRRDDPNVPPVEGDRLVLTDTRSGTIPKGPIADFQMEYIDNQEQSWPLTGCRLENGLARGTNRIHLLPRPQSAGLRGDLYDWSGTLSGTCPLSDGRTAEIDLTFTDCR